MLNQSETVASSPSIDSSSMEQDDDDDASSLDIEQVELRRHGRGIDVFVDLHVHVEASCGGLEVESAARPARVNVPWSDTEEDDDDEWRGSKIVRYCTRKMRDLGRMKFIFGLSFGESSHRCSGGGGRARNRRTLRPPRQFIA